MLKADLHMHTKEGYPRDIISYTAHDLIDHMAKLKFKVMAITLHDKVLYNQSLVNHAKRKGILLIPGFEKTIDRKHVLILGAKKIPKGLKTFDDLEKYKDEYLIVAPHPLYPVHSALGMNLLEKYKDVWGAVEHSFIYNQIYNPNKAAVKFAKKNKIPIIGNSDAHKFEHINHTYTLIDARPKVDSVLSAIRKNRVKLVTKPIPLVQFTRIGFDLATREQVWKLKSLFKNRRV
ncbi:MAG: PHP domain-containing protein [Nanoarchaeota archaeon]|nr:PHP domain-containing protein [Nanoarchaeota archaeon]